ncbi:MAG: hypothetical protein ABTQ73_11615 [Caldilineales bacterium]
MAKKVRKPRSANPRTFGQASTLPAQVASNLPSETSVARTSRAMAAPSQSARQARQVDLRAEYPYVQRDLGKLLLVAAAMFAVLVILNLVLNVVR